LRPFLYAGFVSLFGTFAGFSSMTGAAGGSSTVKVGTDIGSNSSAKRSSSSLDCANSSIASPSRPRLQAPRLRRKRDGAGGLGGRLGRDLDRALGTVRGWDGGETAWGGGREIGGDVFFRLRSSWDVDWLAGWRTRFNVGLTAGGVKWQKGLWLAQDFWWEVLKYQPSQRSGFYLQGVNQTQ
jgi:hypothetical protein